MADHKVEWRLVQREEPQNLDEGEHVHRDGADGQDDQQGPAQQGGHRHHLRYAGMVNEFKAKMISMNKPSMKEQEK